MKPGKLCRWNCWIVVLLWSVLGVTHASTPAPVETAAVIRVGIDLWPGYYPAVIAQQKGFFARRQLQVQYSVPENTDKMLQAFSAGELDVVCVALGDVFAFREKVPSLRVVLISDESSGGDALLSLKPLPPKLDGLRIGTNLNGFGELFVRAFLQQHNTPLNAVTLLNQDASDAAVLLKQGKLDVVHTWEPYVSELTGYHDAMVVFSSAQTPGLIPDAVVLHGSLLQKPELAKAFVAGWIEGAEWWLSRRHEGNRIVERALVMMPNTVNLEGVRLFDGSANRKAFRNNGSPQSLYSVVQTYIDFFREKGVLKTALTPDDILLPGLLP